jgi:uncharacterized membrane protein
MMDDIEGTFSHRQSREQSSRPSAGAGRALQRTLLFTLFTLIEYMRSGRIWIELVATVAFYAVFLRGQLNAEKFFSLVGIYSLVLTIYTMSAIISLGDRPQGYIVLARRVGRAGYVLGLYCSALLILLLVYAVLSTLTATISDLTDLPLNGWLLGSLPLLLNVGLMSALILMLSPLIFSAGWRLFVLGMIALTFSGNFLGSATIEQFPSLAQGVLRTLQTILGWPLVPAFSGFALSLSRDYSGNAPVILVAQASLLVALLSLSIYTFSRRELLLSGE